MTYKPNVPPRPERDRLKLTHEHFFHFVKRPKSGRAKYYYNQAEAEKSGHDVVTYNVRPGENGHTATFPEDLIKPRILSSCPPPRMRSRSILRNRTRALGRVPDGSGCHGI
jgi:site-specific DNA-methyltransferase (cytosine-N4-specific)